MHLPGEKLPKECVCFKKVRVAVMHDSGMCPQCHAVHIPSQTMFFASSVWPPGLNGPQLPL